MVRQTHCRHITYRASAFELHIGEWGTRYMYRFRIDHFGRYTCDSSPHIRRTTAAPAHACITARLRINSCNFFSLFPFLDCFFRSNFLFFSANVFRALSVRPIKLIVWHYRLNKTLFFCFVPRIKRSLSPFCISCSIVPSLRLDLSLTLLSSASSSSSTLTVYINFMLFRFLEWRTTYLLYGVGQLTLNCLWQ